MSTVVDYVIRILDSRTAIRHDHRRHETSVRKRTGNTDKSR